MFCPKSSSCVSQITSEKVRVFLRDKSILIFRTFRLLRIPKLVRFLPNLRRQLIVMLRTMDNVAVFFGLLMLFIFIFSILGMNLFGCKFCDPETKICDRKNFDSLLWATVTVFQVTENLKTCPPFLCFSGAHPRRLEHRAFRGDGADVPLGRPLFRRPHDFRQLRLVQLAGRHSCRGVFQPGES